MVRRVVYTGLFGDYDNLIDPACITPECDFICFTDQKSLVSDVWKVFYLDSSGQSLSIMNRMVKILAHKFLADYDESIYVDANVRIKGDLTSVFDQLDDSCNFFVADHPFRRCVYKELQSCLDSGKISKDLYVELVNKFSKEGFPRNYGLRENNILVRRHKDTEVMRLMCDWFSFVNGVCGRDQVSLMFLAWKRSFSIGCLPWSSKIPNRFFYFRPHKISLSHRSLAKKIAIEISARRADNHVWYFAARGLDCLSHLKARIFGFLN